MQRETRTHVERVEGVDLLLAGLGRRDVDDAEVAHVPPRLAPQDGLGAELGDEDRAGAGESALGRRKLRLDDELVGEV